MLATTTLSIQFFPGKKFEWRAFEPQLPHELTQLGLTPEQRQSLRSAFCEGQACVPMVTEQLEHALLSIATVTGSSAFEARAAAELYRYTLLREYKEGALVFSAGPWEYTW